MTGFVRGGDDYVTKPFSLEELTLRIGALLRRVRGGDGADARLRYRDLEMDEDRHQVWRGGDEVELSPDRVPAAPLLPAQPRAGPVEAADPRPRLAVRLQRRGQRRRDVRQLPAPKVDVAEPRLLRTVRGFGYVLRADGRDRDRRRRRGPRAGRSRRRSRLIPMSLRARLLVSLAVMLSVALLAAGVLLVELDARQPRRSRRSRAPRPQRSGRRAPATRQPDRPDSDAGRRLAVLRLDRQGNVVRSYPSGFATAPDPGPQPAGLRLGHPGRRLRPIEERPAVDGSLSYRVLTQRVRPANITLAIAAPLAGVDAAVAALIRTLLLTGSIALVGLLVVAWFVVRHDLLPARAHRPNGRVDRGRRPDPPGRRAPRRHRGRAARHGVRRDARPDRDELRRAAGGARREGRERGTAAPVRRRRVARAADAADRRARATPTCIGPAG